MLGFKFKYKLSLSRYKIKYQRQVFQITLYYLNFNRIDMKKELRSRIKSSRPNPKSQNQTKPSHHKQRRPPTKPTTQPSNTHPIPIPTRTEDPARDSLQLGGVSGACEFSGDTPSDCNINLDHYLDDICQHITQLDRSFQQGLSRGLKAAANIEITSEMRKILLRWLIKVGRKFRVRSQTIHMCVQLIDYMLIHEGQKFNKTNFQLLGITCLFISCKYNEIYTIQSQKYIEFCDNIYTISQLFQMQSFILLTTNFNLQIPTIHQFLTKIQLECGVNINGTGQCEMLIRALTDLFIFDFNGFNNFTKYELSIGIVYFVSKLFKMDGLKAMLVGYKDGIEPGVFRDCFMAVVGVWKKSHGASGVGVSI